MPGGKAQSLAQFLVPADQLGNRLRKVCRRQRCGVLLRRHWRAGTLIPAL
jgi:hypothetical protein